MKMHASISFLLFSSFIGILVSGASINQEPYVLDDNGTPVKINLAQTQISNPISLSPGELPNRVIFYLYTKATPSNPERLNLGDVGSVSRSHFDPRKPTKIVTHGWQNTYRSKACTLIRDAFLRNGDYNVIVVDWGSITIFEYVWTSQQVVKVAQFVASMIDFLASRGMDLSKTTVIGHSLGAHVAGLSSYYAKRKVNCVVALDPAGPNFHGVGKGQTVSQGDAAYVQVIHTSYLVGTNNHLGDADFYVNGGSAQIGCGVDIGEACSHLRAYEYYAESINSNNFVARSCSSFDDYKSGKCNSRPTAIMGGVNPNFKVKGQYFLTTNSRPPYGKK
ncbi:phospholipase A1 VesT1.02-like [Osmia bicornis bicornis]|uniref:phospholipase A1 VesT1.02-like n=1 Tax=Osmia bicornis bicornis TaxID=1437191 RepID=UPI001EAE9877|nr:phospholipase A1 VesT1.02-like [Osmia bicornis bicornis]